MDSFLTQWIILVSIFSLAVISPGPDLVMIIKNALTHGRRAGFMTALGFGLGVGIHVTYTLAGLATLIAHSILLFTIIKIIGAGYLFYVGFQALRSTGWTPPKDLDQTDVSIQFIPRSDRAAFMDGFWTNVLNPKVTLFFLAIFTQILQPNMMLGQQVILGLTCMLMITVWFSAVAVFMTTPKVRHGFAKFSRTIDRICGVVFIALGVKLILTKLHS